MTRGEELSGTMIPMSEPEREAQAQDSGQKKGAIVRPGGDKAGIKRNPNYPSSDGRIIFIMGYF